MKLSDTKVKTKVYKPRQTNLSAMIEIQKSENETWNDTLNIRGLAEGDYLVLSLDGYMKNDDGEPKNYGKFDSHLTWVDVFEYSYFDAKQRKVIDVKLDEAHRCSYFMSQPIWNKLIDSDIPEGQGFKLSMVPTKTAGRTTYKVESFTPSNISIKDEPKKESNISIDITKLKASGLSKEDIATVLAVKYTPEEIAQNL